MTERRTEASPARQMVDDMRCPAVHPSGARCWLLRGHPSPKHQVRIAYRDPRPFIEWEDAEASPALPPLDPLVKLLNGWVELGEEVGRVLSLMSPEQVEDWFPDWFGPRLFDLQVASTRFTVRAAGPAAEPPQAELVNPVTQVWFRAGLIACREYMARFVEAQSPLIANSIRANWWPALGKDYGPPRQLDFTEVTGGEVDTSSFYVKGAGELSATQEALPIALGFLQQPNEPTPTASAEPRAPLSDPPKIEGDKVICPHCRATLYQIVKAKPRPFRLSDGDDE